MQSHQLAFHRAVQISVSRITELRDMAHSALDKVSQQAAPVREQWPWTWKESLVTVKA